jgi:Fe-S-cluster containining protein
MIGYPETGMCKRCEGECCRLQPGHCLPSEFESAEAVRAAVESGKYTIVLLLDSHIMARVVRPHYKDPGRRAGCIFLHENGCELPLPARPYGCRMLRPRERDGEHCTPEGISIEEAGRMWEQSGYLPPIWKCL